MTKHGHKAGTGRGRGGAPSPRIDSAAEESRPFAEIRRALDDVLHVLSLHRWAFVVSCCLTASGVFIASLYYPRMYSATTTFERRNDPVMIDLPISAGAASFEYFRSTMESDLTSLGTMREVVENLGLNTDFSRDEEGALTEASKRRRDGLARSLGARLRIGRRSPNRQMDIIAITYTGPDPQIGKKLVDEVKRVYIRRTMVWVREFLERQRDYFTREASKAAEELKAAQRDQTMLRLENPYASPGDPGTLSMKLAQLEIEHRELLLRKREYSAERSAFRQMLAALGLHPDSEPLTANRSNAALRALGFLRPELQHLNGKIQSVDDEIEQFRTTRGMLDAHPKIQELLAKRRRLEAAFERDRHVASSGSAANRALDLLGGRWLATEAPPSKWQSDRARLAVQIAAQDTKISELAISLQSNELAIRQLHEAKENLFENQEIFGDVQARVTKARQRHGRLASVLMSIEPAINAISQDRLMQFTEGQPARGSGRPVSPKANTVMILAIMVGVAVGIGCVILAEILDRAYRSSGQVARSLGLPILEAIDEIVTTQDRRRILVRRAVIGPLVLLALAATTGLTGSMAYLSIQKPSAYERLRRIPVAAGRLVGFDVGPPAKQGPSTGS